VDTSTHAFCANGRGDTKGTGFPIIWRGRAEGDRWAAAHGPSKLLPLSPESLLFAFEVALTGLRGGGHFAFVVQGVIEGGAIVNMRPERGGGLIPLIGLPFPSLQ
jgi:hypothetical protein